MLYTSGSTGLPKGVLHTTGGYLLGAAATTKYVFDYHEGDVFGCMVGNWPMLSIRLDLDII